MEQPPDPSGDNASTEADTAPYRRRTRPCRQAVRQALRLMEKVKGRLRRPFPFLDLLTCWDPDEFVRENQRLIEDGFSGARLIDALCEWAADGRIAYLFDREPFLLVRRYDSDQGVIRHDLHPLSRGCGFHCTMLNVKTEGEMEKEYFKNRQSKGSRLHTEEELAEDGECEQTRGPQGDDDNEEAEAEEDRVWPLKEENFIKHYRNSPYARRFYTRTFDPSPEFYAAAEADPKGTKAGTYNSYCGLRWTPQQAREVYEGWTPETREEANRRARIIMDHIRSEVCQEDQEMVDYLLRWILSLVVHPERRMLTMLLFVGPSGCGKSVLVQNVIGPLFGNHYSYNSDLNDLLGKFNAMANDTILAYADEARVNAGTRAAAILKTLITEGAGSLRMELKGRDTTYVDSFLNLIGAVENMTEFQVDIESRRYVPFPFAGNKRGDKEYFARLVSAAVDEERMGLLAFLVHLLDEVDITDFDRGQVLPRAKGQAVREIMGSIELGARDPFREWVRKWVDRGWIVPRNEMDDTDVTRNEHIHWIDSQGRTWATRRHPWISEIQSEVLYARFHKDMGLSRLSGAQIKAGLERGGFLRPECCGPAPVRRRVWCIVGESGGEISFVQLRKTYVALRRCPDYEGMLGINADSEEQQQQEEVAEYHEAMSEGDDEATPPCYVTREQEADFNHLCYIKLVQDAAEEQERQARTASRSKDKGEEKETDQERDQDKGKEKETVQDKSRKEKEADKDKGKEKDDHQEHQRTEAAILSDDELIPGTPVWTPETTYDEDYAAELQAAELQKLQEHVPRHGPQVLPASSRKEKRLRTGRLLSYRPLEALEGSAEPPDEQQLSLRLRKRQKRSHRRASRKRLVGRLMEALLSLSEEGDGDDDEEDRSGSSDSDSEGPSFTATTEAD